MFFVSLLPLKKPWVISGLVLGVLCGFGFGFRFWSNSEWPLPHEALKDLAPYPADPKKIIAASEDELFLRGGGKSWKRIFSFQGQSVSLKKLLPYPKHPTQFFCLTEEGVILIDIEKGRSQWLFRQKDTVRNRIFDLSISPSDPDRLCLGTERGLWTSQDGGKTWKNPTEWPETLPVTFLGFLPTRSPILFVGTPRELFFSRNGGRTYESGFSLSSAPGLTEEGGEELTPSRATPFSQFTSYAFSATEPHRIWVGTRGGVFESRDEGVFWSKLPESGLEDLMILDLIFSDRLGLLVAATRRGVFQFSFSKKRWTKIPLRLVEAPASLTLQQPLQGEAEEKLLVAAGHEIFEWILSPENLPDSNSLFVPSPERIDLFRKLASFEPTVREVQKKAIRYGQFGNGKITRWHWASRLRAFIPDLSFGKDFSLSDNIDIDRGGTNDADRFIRGPEESDKGWDLGLTWDLGDLLYSSNQISIDSRAKSLVELRESILSQVTRLYFERRRILMEILLSPPPAVPSEQMDQKLRLEEITAQIDALTDGFFSKRLEEIERDHPELHELFA